MYKNIALLALLLPFSGYAITKQERKQEILQEFASINKDLEYTLEVIKNNYWVTYLEPDRLIQKAKDAIVKAKALQEELDQIEKELEQEKTCTKK